MHDIIYLASPYSHPDPLERQYRFHQAARAAALLMSQGLIVYSPIAHNHYIAENFELPTEWEYWEFFDRAMLLRCTQMYVLQLGGWQHSIGVNAEIALAIKANIPICYLDLGEFNEDCQYGQLGPAKRDAG